MATIETEEKKMPESTDLEVKQQVGASPEDVRYSADWIAGTPPQEKQTWFEKEAARVREKYARENQEIKERWRQRRENQQTAKREEFLFRSRLNKANRERPMREYEARDAAERESAKGLYATAEPPLVPETPRITKENRILTFFGRQFEIASKETRRNIEQEKQFFDRLAKRLRSPAGFLRGVAASAFKGIGGMSTRVGERLEQKPDSSNRPVSVTPPPGPGLNSLKNNL